MKLGEWSAGVVFCAAVTAAGGAVAQTSSAGTARSPASSAVTDRKHGPPTREAHAPGYPAAAELPDGMNAPAEANGNFVL